MVDRIDELARDRCECRQMYAGSTNASMRWTPRSSNRVQYTEFALERLDAKIEHLDTKVDRLDMKVDRLDMKVDRLDTTVERLDGTVERLDGNVSRIERKLDQFIDTRTKANERVERRLQLLESETQ